LTGEEESMMKENDLNCLDSTDHEVLKLLTALKPLVAFEIEFKQELVMHSYTYPQLIRTFRSSLSSSSTNMGFTIVSYLFHLLSWNSECQKVWKSSEFAQDLMKRLSSIPSSCLNDGGDISGVTAKASSNKRIGHNDIQVSTLN
jgi:hypothetical protein